MTTRIEIAQLAVLACTLCALAGCRGPDSANIALRKENQTLRDQVAQLDRERQSDAAMIRTLQSNNPPLATLSKERIDQLFTTHGLKLGRLTGITDKTLKVYVVPTDEDGQVLKASGSFVVDAFDLSSTEARRVGRWIFDVEAARKCWFGEALLYTYALTCPLETPATGPFTVKVTFVDALTQRTFEIKTEISPK